MAQDSSVEKSAPSRPSAPPRLQAVRGMNDLLPEEASRWRLLEQRLISLMQAYGYQEIRFPLLENTQLFKRSIGEVTDIVEKEMYTFSDLNGDSISLRPEGTAGCVRACLEHGLLRQLPQKLWYLGPMYRHERPQKGRYRQFHQFGVEVFGLPEGAIELEFMLLLRRLWESLGIAEHLRLELNTLGDLPERLAYQTALATYLEAHYESLDADSQRRLHKNILRIFDSKETRTQEILKQAPKLIDFLSLESRRTFENLCQNLEALGIPYSINPALVRGLDYYRATVFEWTTTALGSQATVCAGGRYDALLEQLGGEALPSAGFALGLERILLLMEAVGAILPATKVKGLFVIASNETMLTQAFLITENLRQQLPTWTITLNLLGGSFKSQFKKADKSGADFALILGENELKEEAVSIKNLRQAEEQVKVPLHQLVDYLKRVVK